MSIIIIMVNYYPLKCLLRNYYFRWLCKFFCHQIFLKYESNMKRINLSFVIGLTPPRMRTRSIGNNHRIYIQRANDFAFSHTHLSISAAEGIHIFILTKPVADAVHTIEKKKLYRRCCGHFIKKTAHTTTSSKKRIYKSEKNHPADKVEVFNACLKDESLCYLHVTL